ncbi:MAG: four-helix bundle copper-binding protein [Opitutaceae bacterium]|nr:four-helix bundle copper-binding protein [Opitutaceae bacterium]
MKTIEMMLRSHPHADQQHAEMYADTVHALATCAQTCISCADACLGEPEHLERLRRCIRTNLDCADLCNAAVRVLIRQTETSGDLLHTLLHACVIACQVCGDECEFHADMHDHCRVCAEACRHCQERCNFLLGETSSAGTAEDPNSEGRPTMAH